MGVRPKIIACDFSPSLIGAIREVFGEGVVQIDLFHVMQELNRGIKADLRQYRNGRYDAERDELIALRDWIKGIQKALREGASFQEALTTAGAQPEVNPAHESAAVCLDFTRDAIEILKKRRPPTFFSKLRDFIARLDRSVEPIDYFCDRLLKAMPKKRFTEKGMYRIKKEVLKKLKSLYIHHRKPLAQESKEFYHKQHVLFFQPENLTPKRTEFLEELLDSHPALQKYRKMTLSMGEISRLAPEKIDGRRIDDLSPSPEYTKKLNAAIKTIKNHKEKILHFVDVFKSNPELSRAQRANMEYFNRDFKDVFASGNNLLKKDRLLGRFKAQFSGKVEFHLDKGVIAC